MIHIVYASHVSKAHARAEPGNAVSRSLVFHSFIHSFISFISFIHSDKQKMTRSVSLIGRGFASKWYFDIASRTALLRLAFLLRLNPSSVELEVESRGRGGSSFSF